MNASLSVSPSSARPGGWDAGEAVRVHGAHQEVARAERAVAGEDASGAVGAVRRRRQPDDEHARLTGRRSQAPGGPSRSRLCSAAFFSVAMRWQ